MSCFVCKDFCVNHTNWSISGIKIESYCVLKRWHPGNNTIKILYVNKQLGARIVYWLIIMRWWHIFLVDECNCKFRAALVFWWTYSKSVIIIFKVDANRITYIVYINIYDTDLPPRHSPYKGQHDVYDTPGYYPSPFYIMCLFNKLVYDVLFRSNPLNRM